MTTALSPADVAAHEAASYVRPNARPVADWDDNRKVIPTIPGPRAPQDHDGDSDPDADELLKRVKKPRSNWDICPDCNGALTPRHNCAPRSPSRVAGFSPAGVEALNPSFATVEQMHRDEVEAAYAEYAAQPFVEYREYLAGVAA